MNEWLRPISLRLAERGPSLGGSRVRSEDIRQPQAFLGQARLRPSYDLGRPAHANLGQEPKCCNAPDGTTKCFDHATGVCQNTWNSGSPTPGAPACVMNYRGEWVHPDCWDSPPPPAARLAGRERRLPLLNVNFGPMTRRPMMGDTAPAQQNLIACVNGPDLYDIYNPDMTLVAKAVLNPTSVYPNVQITGFPPCPVPQATGQGGLCDIPHGYEPLPGGGAAKAAVGCFNPKTGWTLFDASTGVVLGTHISGACLTLIGSFSPLPDGDPRCSGGGAATAPPTSTPTPTPTPTPGGSPGAPPPSNGPTVPSSGGQAPSQPSGGQAASSGATGSGIPSSVPIPATGVSVLPQHQNTTSPSSPTGAWPGNPFAAAPGIHPPAPVPVAQAPAPLPPTCPLGPVPLRQWAAGCMGK